MKSGKRCDEWKGIKDNPGHCLGDPVTDARVLKCVLYEAFTLAIALRALESNLWPEEMRYDVPVGQFDPREVMKHAALMEIRLLYDFLYSSDSEDDFAVSKNFSRYGYTQPLATPNWTGLDGGSMFTRTSINRFVAHLTKSRITKPVCTPQPELGEGLRATARNARRILKDVEAFANRVVAHPDFSGLDEDEWGCSYLRGFRTALERLNLP